MSCARQLLDTHPGTSNVDAGVLAAATDAPRPARRSAALRAAAIDS